ncbi:hypothetical protein J7M07_08410 [bacterium]|nr:hypothetical protein [bacterium]
MYIFRKLICSISLLLLFSPPATAIMLEEHIDRNGKVLNIALPGSPVTTNPREVYDVVSVSVLQGNVYETLVRYNQEKLVIEPLLAESWEVREAGRVWVFQLRENVYFHDGTLLTSDDVVKSIRANPFFNGKVEKGGKFIVSFIFPERRTAFVKSLTKFDSAVTKVDKYGSFIGTGPFIMDKWNPPEEVRLKRFSSYWGKKADVERVEFYCNLDAEESFKKMKTGEVDICDVFPPSMLKMVEMDPDIALSTLKGANMSFVHININNPPLDNSEFRKALNLAVRKEKLIDDVLYGYGIGFKGLFPPVLGGKSTGPLRVGFDQSEASKIIKTFLDDNGRVFKMIGLPFARPYCPEPEVEARLIAGYLRDAGLKIEYVKTHTMEEYLKYLNGDNYDLVVCGWVMDAPNFDGYITQIFGLGGAKSIFGVHWENDEFEQLVISARKTVSLRKQWEYYNAAQEIFFREYPWIFIAFTDQFGIYRNNIKGIRFNTTGELRLNQIVKN